MKYYILFGPPGAGKGTHAGAIAQKYNLKHLSTGELLRAEIAAGTELGLKARDLIAAGNLVPDEIVEGMIENAFDTIKGVDGFLLDGFPRTIAQAEALEQMTAARNDEVTGVISIMIPDAVVHERIAHRAAIEGRADDASDATITHRIETYHAQTEPLIDFYKAKGKYHEVCGYPGSIDDVRERVLSLVEEF
ncbi:MAG: adenylate kinase [Bacteroidales bacterium]|nr:adenylate kinase [Bacteroidales bacterium]